MSTEIVPVTGNLPTLFDDSMSDELRQVYSQVSDQDIVDFCEHHRKAISSDILQHLRAIRDALAPFGLFSKWCESLNIPYSRIHNLLDSPNWESKRTSRISNGAGKLTDGERIIHAVGKFDFLDNDTVKTFKDNTYDWLKTLPRVERTDTARKLERIGWALFQASKSFSQWEAL
jgi:hypothetical protein